MIAIYTQRSTEKREDSPTSRPTSTKRQDAENAAGRAFKDQLLTPLLWLSPAILLVAGVVIWPVIVLARSALSDIDPSGFDNGFAGLENFTNLFAEPGLSGVMIRTCIWVVAIVMLTVGISLPMAALLNTTFPGRRVVMAAVVAPWAASVMMTAIIYKWMLDPQNGLVNIILNRVGLMGSLGSTEADWLGRPTAAFVWMIGVAVFVSVPFTTFTILSGMQSIPDELYEASALDGAGALRRYFAITLPLLRPALLVGMLVNVINVLNSFPIIWSMTRGGPGYETSTTVIFMYQLKGSDIGMSSALSILNLAIVALVVIVVLKFGKWKEQVS